MVARRVGVCVVRWAGCVVDLLPYESSGLREWSELSDGGGHVGGARWRWMGGGRALTGIRYFHQVEFCRLSFPRLELAEIAVPRDWVSLPGASSDFLARTTFPTASST